MIADGVHLMTSSREFFAGLGSSGKQVGDPATTSMVAFAFDFPSREDVDAFVERARAAGARIGGIDDYGFMYGAALCEAIAALGRWGATERPAAAP